jgi:hypothetical protein
MLQTTFPLFGKLFCFDTVENAKRYYAENIVILKGFGSYPTKQKLMSGFLPRDKDFWKAFEQKKKLPDSIPSLKGTVTVYSFIPYEIVEEL